MKVDIKKKLQYYYETKGSCNTGSYCLMFHVVSNNKEEWYKDEYSISEHSFEDLIMELVKRGYEICSVEDFVKLRKSKKILITFDDAFSCVYRQAFPFLKKNGYPFVVFQTVGNLGRDGYLNEKMIKEMLQYEKFTLGTHTISHKAVSDFRFKESLREIKQPKEIFKRAFDYESYAFAFPYGSLYSFSLKDWYISRKWYKYTFSTLQAPYGKWNLFKKYLIPRFNINEINYRKFLKGIDQEKLS